MDCDEILNVSSSNCSIKKGKRVRIKEPQCANKIELDRPEMESDDEFEKEMNSVFEERVQQAELNGGIITSIYEKLQSKEKQANSKSQSSSSGDKNSYDPIYFDSDDSDNDTEFQLPESSNSKNDKSQKRKIPSNEELMYDPDLDDQDQTWADNIRNGYTPEESSGIPHDNPKPSKNSSAVLNCPACFVVLCIDCQQHEIYQHQYRAMFVMNCKEDTAKKLTFPVIKTKSKKKGKNVQNEFSNELDPDEIFHPVKCVQCSTQVAMFDSDEVYHFFNVLASHG